jgi:hypothetical protein
MGCGRDDIEVVDDEIDRVMLEQMLSGLNNS